jgi:cholesterol oxidase
MSQSFDAIVIGSGFGGAVTACRVAEKGMKVLVLERGRRWAPKEYPRSAGDAVVQRPPALQRLARPPILPEHDDRAGAIGRRLAAKQLALEMHPSSFTNGWPEITQKS